MCPFPSASLQTLTGDSLSQSAEANIVGIRTFCNKVSKAPTRVEKMLEARDDVLDDGRRCSGWLWWMFIEVSVYEEMLQVNISRIFCVAVSLLPWAGRKGCLALQNQSWALAVSSRSTERRSDSRYPARHSCFPLQAPAISLANST